MINPGRDYLLVQSCSNRKRTADAPLPALDLYDGYFYRIIKNSPYGSAEGPNVDLRILSAKHGLLLPDDKIAAYDRTMDSERAAEIRTEVVDSLTETVRTNEYDSVVINLGQPYQVAITGLEDAIDVPVVVIEGSGIGEKGQRLKWFLAGKPIQVEGEC